MSSGFPGGDLYGSSGPGGGSATISRVRYQYGPELRGGNLPDPSIRPPNSSSISKRSFMELEKTFLLRSVKQRSYQTPPISPLSPFDFSTVSPDNSTASSSLKHGLSVLPNPPNFFEPDPAKKMRNRLEELERQLLDDTDDYDGGASGLTNSQWTDTMHSLIKPLSLTSASVPSNQLLIDCASAISDGDLDTAREILSRLKQISNPNGDPEQRLTAYMVATLRSRIIPLEKSPIAELCTADHQIATQLLYEASPCFKLGFTAANLAILESTHDQSNLHLIDFDIGNGSQYTTLIYALAARRSCKPTVKITAVNDPTTVSNSATTQILRINRLTQLAGQLGVSLRFNSVRLKVTDLNLETLGCELDEAVAVNFGFWLHTVPDESVSTSNPRDDLLRRVKGLNPRVVTLVEQEMNTNTAPFVARFTEVSSYYRALFQSMDATMGRESVEMIRVEEYLARKAANSVGREGRERVVRCEVFGKWRARMGMAGFESRPLGSRLAEWMRVQLALNKTNSAGFFVKEEAGGLCFGWMGRVLTVASAWR